MIDYVVYHQALIRELINGVAFILFLTLVLMITVFLWDTWVVKGPLPYDKWKSVPGVPTACALWWIFAAEAYRTCNVWLSYNLGKVPAKTTLSDGITGVVGVGIFSSSTVYSTLGYLFAGLILCAGLLRAIYIFTPPDWKARVWVYAIIGAIAFVSTPTLFTIMGI